MNLLSRPPHRKRSERGRASGSEGVWLIVEKFHAGPPQLTDMDRLSERELDVLRLLARGLVYKEIATDLDLSFHTGHTLVRRIYEKLHVHTRRQAVARFHQANRQQPPA